MRPSITPLKVFALLIYFSFFSNSFAQPITAIVTDRAGIDVSGETLINSDNIHIDISSSTNIESYVYKYKKQSTIPLAGDWNAIESFDFYEDIYLFRKTENQWVQLVVSDGVNTSEFVYGLQGGVLTAPPDDPITPVEYVAAMGPGLIVEGDSDRDVGPELDVVEIKKAGFNHVRMHIGRSASINLDITPEAEYFQAMDRYIEQITRHGLQCHIGNKTKSGRGLEEISDGSAAWNALYHAEMLDWWTKVSHYYQNASHRLAYHIFLETGKSSFCANANTLNNLYKDVTEEVRKVDSARLLIYPPPRLNDAERLPEMTFPYPDLNPGDGIKTGSGNYFFSDFHKGFASGAQWQTNAEKKTVDDILDIEGDQALLGKNIGSDTSNEKATYPKAVGMEQAKIDAQELIDEAQVLFDDFDENALKHIARYIAQRQK
jgi:hypothetical protein